MKFYVEAGANDGIQQSRSLHLKNDLAYHGMLHDPANHEEEKKQIVTICEEFNLINSETIKNDGNYKLVFNK